jgi:S-adenosylmethionine:tRNA ribosyltransferase-isomerase
MPERPKTTTDLRVTDFDFDLPEELIAQQPPAERGQSRMLVMDRATGAVRDGQFAEFPSLLRPGDLLVLNDTRVIPARLYAQRTLIREREKPTGRIEVLLTEPVAPQSLGAPGPGSPRTGLRPWGGGPDSGTRESTNHLGAPGLDSETGDSRNSLGAPSIPRSSAEWVGDRESHPAARGNLWRALVKPGRKVAIGERLVFPSPSGEIMLKAEVLERGQFGDRLLQFEPVEDFFGVLERIGHVPLPPYIHRNDADTDRERYQTVYSRERGSVAAPTAGLHFTPEILSAAEARGVEIARLTLHVGLGTFAPLRVERVDEIHLHRERYTLSDATADALNRAVSEGRRIVAVGTTVVRTLEHCAQQANGAPLEGHSGVTEIFISPGFQFRLVGGLLTNFHLPQSSLIMLVSAFAGREKVLAAYRHAVQEKYHFFSYGDCMFLA